MLHLFFLKFINLSNFSQNLAHISYRTWMLRIQEAENGRRCQKYPNSIDKATYKNKVSAFRCNLDICHNTQREPKFAVFPRKTAFKKLTEASFGGCASIVECNPRQQNTLSFVMMSVNDMRSTSDIQHVDRRFPQFLTNALFSSCFMKDELTIIVPIFNEEESLPTFFSAMDEFIELSPLPSQVLLVNDGSSDNSRQIIEEKCRNSSQYSGLTLDRNYGLSSAIKAGFDHCVTNLVGYIDADLQTDPADFLSYLAHFPEYDMVNGIRQKRKDSLTKRISSKVANTYRRFMIDDGIDDTCCPLKILKTSYARKVPFFNGMHRFLPALVQLEGGKVKQVPVSHYPRLAGTSKYHLFNRLIGPFFDTLAFRWMRNRHIRYGLANNKP